ncbi:MAG: four helix bundle protein [Acidimicrobiia bacterium]|nr:four helix bundle protein [Acidimicrobiia bacterium]
MEVLRDFKKVVAWRRAHELALSLYRVTRSFPTEERYGLASQIRRAAVSIPSNIAEGAGRRTPADYARFIDIALGSTNEVEYQLLLAHQLGYIGGSEHAARARDVSEVRKMCIGLRSAILSGDVP